MMGKYHTESLIDALRYIKENHEQIEEHFPVYLIHNEHTEDYNVFTGYCADSDAQEFIQQQYNDWGCDGSPEYHADGYKVWEYAAYINRTNYPTLYKKDSLLLGGKTLCRTLKNIEPEYSVTFGWF